MHGQTRRPSHGRRRDGMLRFERGIGESCIEVLLALQPPFIVIICSLGTGSESGPDDEDSSSDVGGVPFTSSRNPDPALGRLLSVSWCNADIIIALASIRAISMISAVYWFGFCHACHF